MAETQVWLITGASSGFGLEIALAALKAGHKIIGSVRSRQKSADAVQKIESAGGKTIELDLSKDAKSIQARAKQAEEIFGKIDTLINNAGYSLLGAIEDLGDQEAHAQLETNFFGPLFLIQAILPGMRARKHGTIVNISSIAGVDGMAACGLYAASKFALEGMSESLAREVSPFGIRVLIVEPGAFRTNFLAAFVPNSKGVGPDYENGPVREVLQKFEVTNGKQVGDPVKGAKAIVDVINSDSIDACSVNGQKVLRLPLGKDCLGRMTIKVDALKHDMEASRVVAEGTDVA